MAYSTSSLISTFYLTSKDPVHDADHYDFACDLVNAFSIALNISWQDAVKKVLEQVHHCCLMPSDRKCIEGMLADNGFVLQPSIPGHQTVDRFCSNLHTRYRDGEIIILTSKAKTIGAYAAALMPGPDGSYRIYSRYDCRTRAAEKIWIRWPDGKDHSFSKRRRGRTGKSEKQRPEPRSCGCFHYINQNPAGNSTGDCVLRALSSAMGISWHEVADGLMASAGYTRLDINNPAVFNKYLSDNGFVRHKALRADGHSLKGEAFCREVRSHCLHGERIFAMSGRSHAIAVMPDEKSFDLSYHIEDSWDSSRRIVGEYWTSPSKRKHLLPSVPKQAPPAYHFVPDQILWHPAFDRGRIVGTSSGHPDILLVDFDDFGLKKISAPWAASHCRLSGA